MSAPAEHQTTFGGWVIAKLVAVWGLIGVSSWSEAAAIVGCIYSTCLLIEWIFKKGIPAIKALRRKYGN